MQISNSTGELQQYPEILAFIISVLAVTAEVCPHMVPVRSKSSFLFDTSDQQLPRFNEVF